MKKEIKEKWVKVLRSGEYEQGKLSLRINDKFCCLGVLCDLHRIESNGRYHWEEIKNGVYGYMEREAMPSKKVRDWAGEESLSSLEHYHRLAQMNDGGATFEEIADTIEANF